MWTFSKQRKMVMCVHQLNGKAMITYMNIQYDKRGNGFVFP